MSKNVSDLLTASMAKLRDMVDANTVVGDPIRLNAQIAIIPVSKITFGFASGGADLASKAQDPSKNFGGGAGCGVSIIPVAFIIIEGTHIRVQPVDVPAASAAERMIEQIPGLVDKLAEALENRKAEKNKFE